MALHRLPLEQRTLHGRFSRDLEPVLTVDPGDSVRIVVPNSPWYLDSGEEFGRGNPELDTGHALAGPIAVRCVRAGQTLVVAIDDVVSGSWGFTPAEDGGVRWELEGGTGRGLGRAVRLEPFLGVLGMPNIDCKELVAGTTLYLPISVDGALVLAGVGVDLRITQVVNETLGVHAVLRNDAFR